MILYNPPWTEQVCRRLVELHEGLQLSQREICAALNHEFGLDLTRNATIGRMHRMGLTGTKRKRVIVPPPPPPAPPPPPPMVEEPAPIDPEPGLTIYQLTDTTCKWPGTDIDSTPPYRYCGAPTVDLLPYCPEHCARAFNNPHKRWE